MNSSSWTRLLALAGALFVCWGIPSGCAHGPSTSRPIAAPIADRIREDVGAVLTRQVSAWNAGDIPTFMEGYARSENTRFASGGTITRGWATVLQRYQSRYQDRKAMGHLEFSGLEFSVLSSDSVMVFGHWRLKREADQPGGLFTLIFQRTDAGWRIVHDHTSAETPN